MRIAVFAGGGDSPGMNACVAAITLSGARHGLQTLGLRGGLAGLLAGDIVTLEPRDVSHHRHRGGIFLGTSRERSILDNREDLAARLRELGINALVALGGDGTISACSLLSSAGVPVVGIPCSIDNDIYGTDYSIGFDTACNKATRAIAEIADTATSLPGRVFLVETLGGSTGFIALASARASGADAVLVPEIEPDIRTIATRLRSEMDAGRPYSIIVVSEGIGQVTSIADAFEKAIGRRVRITSLGHAQRGGSPSFADLTIARRMAHHAVEALVSGQSDVMVALRADQLLSIPLTGLDHSRKPIDTGAYQSINHL